MIVKQLSNLVFWGQLAHLLPLMTPEHPSLQPKRNQSDRSMRYIPIIISGGRRRSDLSAPSRTVLTHLAPSTALVFNAHLTGKLTVMSSLIGLRELRLKNLPTMQRPRKSAQHRRLAASQQYQHHPQEQHPLLQQYHQQPRQRSPIVSHLNAGHQVRLLSTAPCRLDQVSVLNPECR